jgi:hypothetical protein
MWGGGVNRRKVLNKRSPATNLKLIREYENAYPLPHLKPDKLVLNAWQEQRDLERNWTATFRFGGENSIH